MFKKIIDFIRAYQLRRDFERTSKKLIDKMSRNIMQNPQVVPDYFKTVGSDGELIAVSVGVGDYVWGIDESAAISIEVCRMRQLAKERNVEYQGSVTFHTV